MPHSAHLDSAARANAQQGLYALHEAERRGQPADFAFLQDGRWLGDTAVVEHVVRLRGEWRVELVFVYVHNLLRFLKRYITAHPSRHRAAQQAHYMRRLAAKDQRGTLTISVEQLALCAN